MSHRLLTLDATNRQTDRTAYYHSVLDAHLKSRIIFTNSANSIEEKSKRSAYPATLPNDAEHLLTSSRRTQTYGTAHFIHNCMDSHSEHSNCMDSHSEYSTMSQTWHATHRKCRPTSDKFFDLLGYCGVDGRCSKLSPDKRQILQHGPLQ